MQVKIIVGKSYAELETKINEFLDGLPEDPKSVNVDLENWSAIIEYDKVIKALCCDCKHWDDSGDSSALVGLCQKHGGRKRFSSRCCKEFEDVRE